MQISIVMYNYIVYRIIMLDNYAISYNYAN